MITERYNEAMIRTQRKLAQAVKVSQVSICKYLNGKMRPRWLVARRLEKATGIPAPMWMEATPKELKAAWAEVQG